MKIISLPMYLMWDSHRWNVLFFLFCCQSIMDQMWDKILVVYKEQEYKTFLALLLDFLYQRSKIIIEFVWSCQACEKIESEDLLVLFIIFVFFFSLYFFRMEKTTVVWMMEAGLFATLLHLFCVQESKMYIYSLSEPPKYENNFLSYFIFFYTWSHFSNL